MKFKVGWWYRLVDTMQSFNGDIMNDYQWHKCVESVPDGEWTAVKMESESGTPTTRQYAYDEAQYNPGTRDKNTVSSPAPELNVREA